MSIKQLPPDAVEKIKSTVTITSLHEVVSNLIKNSLDASATKIHATFDCSRGSCSVEDNGRGIPPSEFEPDGGLGKLRRMSS
jgi:DNA mismatch repair protein MLH3